LSRRTILLAVLTALLAFAWAAAPAYAVELAPPAPHSPNAEATHSSYVVMIVVTFAVIIVINGALIAAVVRFRERRGREPSRFAAGRGAFRPVIGVLSLLAIAIFVFGVIKTNDAREIEPSGPNGLGGDQTAQVGVKGLPPVSVAVDEQSATGEQPISGTEPADSSPLQIDAIAQQWLWRFEYPGGRPGQRTFSYGELVVPVDTAVVLNITSTDVLHSWHVPALGGQVQASPGDVVQTWFKADTVGRYAGASTMFSGTSFPAMRAWVRVVTVPEYQAYVERLGQELTEAQGIVQDVQGAQDAE
jgi:cytochrome c oxidase subunit 2